MKLLLLESSDIGVRYSAEAARDLGYEPVFLCNLAHYQGDPLTQLRQYEHYDCRTDSVEAVRATIDAHALRDIAAVTSFADTRLKVAVETARALGVAGLDPAVALLKDKGTVARMVPEYSPDSVVVTPDNIPATQLLDLLRKHDRLILKPVEGAGGAGISFLTNADDVAGLDARLNGASHTDMWLAQQIIDGPLVSAEGYVREGRARILGFSGRRKIRGTETGADFPIDDRLPSEVRARAVEAIHALCARSGFRNGYFHIEFLCTHDSCLLIDANVGRIGGGAIAEQIAVAYGITPEQVFRHVLELSLFGFEEPQLYRDHVPRRSTYAILYGLEKGGRVHEVKLPADSNCYHTQIIGCGNPVSPMGQDDWSWVGILSGETEATLATIDRLRIRASRPGATPEDLRPCY